MSTKTWRFEPVDTWFFRESRPHAPVGGSELGSLFPPPARTLAGAMRTLMGERVQADWVEFKSNSTYTVNGIQLREEIGFGNDLGKLKLSGPWLMQGSGRLYPAPAFLLGKKVGKQWEFFTRLKIGEVVHCDLGRVRLPVLDAGKEGFKLLEGAWLTRAGLEKVLAGGVPGAGDVVTKEKLFDEEPRLGIARNNEQRTVKQEMLYQTRHIRPNRGVDLAVEVEAEGIDPRLHPKSDLIRLGGEGRLAAVKVMEPTAQLPATPSPNSKTKGLILTLLTHADLGPHWYPPGFQALEQDGVIVWRGTFNGVTLTIHAAALGKAHREGGWDLVAHQPRAVKSLILAGSAWYCTVEEQLDSAIQALNGSQIGEEQALGRGLLAVGLWTKDENLEQGALP